MTSARAMARGVPPGPRRATVRRRPRPAWQRLTAVAAAIALVLGVGLAVLNVFSADSGSGTTTVALAAPDGRVAVTARLHTDGSGEIVRSALPPAPTGHEYQLWTQPTPGASMRSAGLLGAADGLSGHAGILRARAGEFLEGIRRA